MMQFRKTEKYLRARAGAGILAAVVLLFLYQAPAFSAQMWEELLQEQIEQANAGDADAQYGVGIKYLNGQGVHQNRKEATRWLEKAAASGHEGAKDKLQRMQDQEEQFEKLLSQAEAGDLEAQYQTGIMYLKGKGVEMNGRKARLWVGKAADKGDQKAITRLGKMYYKGEGGEEDYKSALKLFNSVSNDSVLAQYYLGDMYAEGNGVSRNYAAAITWYKKAADGGFGRASGKIINMEEELRMEKRRKKNAAQKEESNKAEAQLAMNTRKAKIEQQANAAQLAADRKAAAQRKEKVAAKTKKAPKLTPLEKLASRQWTRKKKAVEYLPSKATECEMENGKLVCFSGLMTRISGSNTVHYRVKSEVTAARGVFYATYRSLVVDVVSIESDDAELLAYNDEKEQGFHIKTGWTQDHKVECKLNAGGGLDCIKDKTHKIVIAGK
jgi:TPR repeat protein